jgi:hypothetical protein
MARTLVEQAGGPTVVTILRDLAAGRTFEAAYQQRVALPFAHFAESLGPSH